MVPSRSELFDLSQIIATKKHERVNFAVNVLQKDILTKDATLWNLQLWENQDIDHLTNFAENKEGKIRENEKILFPL